MSKENLKYILILLVFAVLTGSVNFAYSQQDNDLQKAYDLLNTGNTDLALPILESYAKENPADTKIYLQIAYIYQQKKNFDKAKMNFDYVIANSKNDEEVSSSKKSLDYIRDNASEIEKSIIAERLQKQNSADFLNNGYNFLDKGDTLGSIDAFKSYLVLNPTDTKIYLQIAYIYQQKQDFDKAKVNFEYVIANSKSDEEISAAKKSLAYLLPEKTIEKPVNTYIYQKQDTTDLLNKGYEYVNKGDSRGAIDAFRAYLVQNPNDVKVHLQLAYLYDQNKSYENAYKSFDFVSRYSNDIDEIDAARISMYFLREQMYQNAPRSFDIYFYNSYDSYYHNYISNLLAHINFKLGNAPVYIGPYLDTYLDSRSSSSEIFNDRYIEIGGFFKYNIASFMSFELRSGYVREIDLKTNKWNVKPMLSIGTRLGNPGFYKARKTSKTENFYMDLYGVGLYDHKFENFFMEIAFREVLRYLTGGYSYIEFYLGQQIMADSKKLDYNNTFDFSAGISFKPDLLNFPVLFLEAVNRSYLRDVNGNFLTGNLKNIFQIRGGFLIYYNSKL